MAKNTSSVTTLDDDSTAPAGADNGVDSAAAAADASAAATQVLGKNHDSDLSGKRVSITIHEVDGDAGSDAVSLGLNGFAYQIPRGVTVSIPEELFEVLANAKTTSYKAGAGGVTIPKTVQRFAYTVNG